MSDSLVGGGDGQTPVHPDDLHGLRPRWILTQGQLNEVERDNLLRGSRWAHSQNRALDAILDDDFIRTLHRQCFGDVWSWAGTYRKRATTIGVDWRHVTTAVRDLVNDARIWFGESGTPSMRDDIARLHHRFVAIHPFPNGNGRTARLFADVVAVALGHTIPDWSSHSPTARSDYLASLRLADRGELEPLIDFMWAGTLGE
jgi:Fic-DOC domain mobile mystery protein B